MATELKLPDLGENVHAGNVVRVMVSEGDVITEQQPILELETDKAAIEVPAAQGGTVVKVHVKQGEQVKVGDTVISIDAKEGARPRDQEEAETTPPAERPKDSEARKSPEPAVSQATEEPPPSTREAPAAATGSAKASSKPAKPAGEPAPPVAPAAEPAPRPAASAGDEEPGPSQLVAAAPSVRRFAREIGVDIAQVKGSGPNERISIEDVKAHARGSRSPQAAQPAGVPVAAQPLPDFSRWGATSREPFSGVRRATARQMAAAWTTIPHVTQFDRADVTDLEEIRKKYAPKAERSGGKLTVTAIVLKVVASALKVFPKFNASIDIASGEVIYKHYYHVGVAVDTDRGLLVPVIRDVDQKNVLQLAVELSSISEKTRSGRLSLEEMQGGCFTISNLGGIGGTAFAPIVNLPEVAILGIARSSLEPVYLDGQFQPRMMLPLSLSYDHRLIDGADGARFLRWVAEALEQPFLLSLEG